MAANEMSKKIGMMGKYAPKEMKEGRSTYPGPTMEHLEEGLDILVRKMTVLMRKLKKLLKIWMTKVTKHLNYVFINLNNFTRHK